MATQTRNPTSDISFTGTWTGSAGTRYQAIDDHPDSGNPIADGLTHGTTTPGEGIMGFSPFNVPAGSTSISIQVLFYDFKNASQTCAIAGAIRCNDTTNRTAGSHNPGNGNANIALRTINYATNPKSAAAWTVDDVNGVGTNGLTAFGVAATDANPSITISSIQLQVTYTPPASRGQISWAEFEVPTAPRRGQVSWAEFEVPPSPRRSRISWAELEVPDASADRRGQISWSEFEIPTAPRRGEISFAEFEIPSGPRRGQVSFAELEIPIAPRRGEISFAELEIPFGPRRGEISFAEFEIPTAPRRGEVSFVEFEVPLAPRRGQISWSEFEVPSLTGDRRSQVSFAEFEIPTAPRRGEISFAELEVPLAPRRGQISWAEFQIPEFSSDRCAQISYAGLEVPPVRLFVLVESADRIMVAERPIEFEFMEVLERFLVEEASE